MANRDNKHTRDRMRKGPNHSFFDAQAYYAIKKIAKSFPDIAYKRAKEYVKDYPEDFRGYILYIETLISIGKLAEAEKCLNRVSDFDERFIGEKGLKAIERLSRSLEMYRSSPDNIITFMSPSISDDSYLKQQLVNYSFERFLEHLDRHIDDDNNSEKDENKSLFRYGLDINKLIEEVLKHISRTNKIYKSDVVDIYYFKLDGCGSQKGKSRDYFQVVCIHDTHNIITMFPRHKCSPDICTDLNYLNEEGYQRPRSQREKFLSKYRDYSNKNN